MKLTDAIEQARNGQVVQREYTIQNGMVFTMWGRVSVTKQGRFLTAGETDSWGALKLDDLHADNWELVE